MRLPSDPVPALLSTPAPPIEMRVLSELHAIQTTLVRLTEILGHMAEILERSANRR
jgi:hypothetical protein